jgi:hypothetical protein
MLIMSQRLALEFEEILITFKGDRSSGALNTSRFVMSLICWWKGRVQVVQPQVWVCLYKLTGIHPTGLS